MEQIREYPFEFAKPLLLCFDLLNRCNIRFFDVNVPFVVKYWRFAYIIPFVLIHYTSIAVYIIKIPFGLGNVFELAYMVPISLVQTKCILKALIMIPKKDTITKLVIHLGTMWRVQNLTELQINKKNNLLKKLNLIQRVYYWGSMSAAYQHYIAPFILTVYYKFIVNQESPLRLPFSAIYPFDPVKNWYIYLTVYAFQTFSMLRVAYFYVGSEFLMITLSAHITTQFVLLREDLVEAVPADDENAATGLEPRSESITINEFMSRHQELIQLSKQLNDIFNRMIFVDLVFATIIICFFGFAATVIPDMVEKINNYVAVLALMFPLYIFCFYGNLLYEESAGIADSAYENLWYLRNTRYQRIISFIIMRSQKPCCLTSLKYVPITLNTFTKVVSTTWSYFSLVTSLYSES